MQIRNYVKQRKISLTLSTKIKISIAQKHTLEQKLLRGDLAEREDGAGAGDEVPEGVGRDRVLMDATK